VDAPTVTTSGLVLRAWTPDDRAPFANINADPQVMEQFPAVLTGEESNVSVDRIVAGWSRGYGL